MIVTASILYHRTVTDIHNYFDVPCKIHHLALVLVTRMSSFVMSLYLGSKATGGGEVVVIKVVVIKVVALK